MRPAQQAQQHLERRRLVGRRRRRGHLVAVRRHVRALPGSRADTPPAGRGAPTVATRPDCGLWSGMAPAAARDAGTVMSGRITRTEVVAALSLATDLAMGDPLESGLTVCRVAMAVAEDAGLGDRERDRVFYVALLRHVGCTAENGPFAEIVGDEIAFRSGVGP